MIGTSKRFYFKSGRLYQTSHRRSQTSRIYLADVRQSPDKLFFHDFQPPKGTKVLEVLAF